jgi:hypothetical protein
MEQQEEGGRVEQLVNRFIERYRPEYEQELINIAARLRSMGNKTGCLECFFKLDEGLKVDDMVCALYDIPDRFLRMYCIRPSEQILIVGDGGPKHTRTWQQDPQLKKAVEEMMAVSEILRTKMDFGDLWISDSGLQLEGDLTIMGR